jgi:hypothetical protein
MAKYLIAVIALAAVAALAVAADAVLAFGRPPQPLPLGEVQWFDERVLDRLTGRPGPHHLVRGAMQHEDLVFDLPRDVEQPAIVFLPANDPMGMLELAAGVFWQPHRFNIRYD